MKEELEVVVDRNGNVLHKGDCVVWHDFETGLETKYEVYEEPSYDMVKLWNEYSECEAFPFECEKVF